MRIDELFWSDALLDFYLRYQQGLSYTIILVWLLAFIFKLIIKGFVLSYALNEGVVFTVFVQVNVVGEIYSCKLNTDYFPLS